MIVKAQCILHLQLVYWFTVLESSSTQIVKSIKILFFMTIRENNYHSVVIHVFSD